MTFDNDDMFAGGSRNLLAPSRAGGPRRTPSRQSMKPKRSTASLRGGSSLAQALDDDAVNGRHSLAHELAFALMPEPSAGSKLLAEEFGIEYDEGAEGIDAQTQEHEVNGESLAQALNGHAIDSLDESQPTFSLDPPADDILELESPMLLEPQPAVDPMDSLASDLETTGKLIGDLRRLDADSGPSASQSSLEKIASDMIRRIDEAAREREGQVRELLEYEREFRKISGEINGNDVLGQLDPLDDLEDLTDKPVTAESSRTIGSSSSIPSQKTARLHARDASNDWETNPDDHRLGDEDGYDSDPDLTSPVKDTFPQPPPLINGPPTAAKALPHFVHVRSLTSTLASSLIAISEHAQVNGAASTDAGRKIRALKNKMGNWRTEWDSAERSRVRIERWEAGLGDDDTVTSVPGTPPRPGTKRVDGRRVVAEQLRAFETALADAGAKTQAIMARS